MLYRWNDSSSLSSLLGLLSILKYTLYFLLLSYSYRIANRKKSTQYKMHVCDCCKKKKSIHVDPAYTVICSFSNDFANIKFVLNRYFQRTGFIFASRVGVTWINVLQQKFYRYCCESRPPPPSQMVVSNELHWHRSLTDTRFLHSLKCKMAMTSVTLYSL